MQLRIANVLRGHEDSDRQGAPLLFHEYQNAVVLIEISMSSTSLLNSSQSMTLEMEQCQI